MTPVSRRCHGVADSVDRGAAGKWKQPRDIVEGRQGDLGTNEDIIRGQRDCASGSLSSSP